jgi:hypothetical protein
MPRSAEPSSPFVSRLSLVGRGTGLVKNLAGFRKQHHTVPDAVNPATTAFLGKLCASDLAEEAEQLFQRAKEGFHYKRTDLSLDVSSPVAVLTARDFTLELAYAFEKSNPSAYEVTRTLHSLADGSVARPELKTLFAGAFSSLVFALTKGVKVEAVIDAVEAQEETGGLRVAYPSDCRHCVLSVAEVTAEVICDGATLEMRFPRPGSPAELVDSFVAVRSAFALSKNKVLGSLL